MNFDPPTPDTAGADAHDAFVARWAFPILLVGLVGAVAIFGGLAPARRSLPAPA